MKTKRYSSGGFSSVMAVIFVTLFSVLAISFTAMNDINVQMSRNHRDLYAAQAAAESGLEYAKYLIRDYIIYGADSTVRNVVSSDDAMNSFENLAAYLQDELGELVGQTIPDPVTFSSSGQTGRELVIPVIAFSSGDRAGFSLKVRQYNNDPKTLDIVSTGNMAGTSRSVRVNYTMSKDTSVLDYSVVSRSRLIITGNSTLERGVYSAWKHSEIANPIELSAESTVNGDINTSLSEEDFSEEAIAGNYEEINYDQPEIDWPEAGEFDTSMYGDMTANLSSGHTYNQKEYFPHAPGDYTKPANWTSISLNRTVYENKTITNRKLASGNNALFKNCIFEGIFYITGGIGVNNIRFENCVFNGPIITGEVPKFGPETWKKNVLYFTGSSTFNNTTMEETTILAPNFNVNIGNTQTLESSSESVLKGVVLGGIVDIRGNVKVDGTIISMADPDPEEWGSAAGQVATNIGYSDENQEAGIPEEDGVIFVSPDPDRNLPIGMSSKIILSMDADSYVEL
jgi:hypothetical protein